MTASCCSTEGLPIGSKFSPSVLFFQSSKPFLTLTSPGWEDGDLVDGHLRLVGGKPSVQEEVVSVVLNGGNPSVIDETSEKIDGGTADGL